MTAVTQAEAERVRTDNQARLGIVPPQRFPMEIRYGREMGWLAVRDVHTGEWHEVRSQDAPPSWRRAAYDEKQRRKQQRQQEEAMAL